MLSTYDHWEAGATCAPGNQYTTANRIKISFDDLRLVGASFGATRSANAVGQGIQMKVD